MSDLHFVFLQGMPSPFFSRIAEALAARGCRTTRINLCIGDRLFWHGSPALDYRGRLKDWPAFVADFFDHNGVTDLILLGEQRNYHKLAIEVAQARGIRVTVTDFGYLRPDWINLERDGMSGNSHFPRDIGPILILAAGLPRADLAPHYRDSSLNMALGDLLYSFANVFLGWLYPHYCRSDKRPHPLLYFPLIGKRLLFARAGQRRAQQQVHVLRATRTRYYLFPLQLEHDFQIVAYSPFRALDEAIRLVIESFSRHSEEDTRLVIKVHPWDPVLHDWGKRIQRQAREFGVENRVDYLDGGSLDELLPDCLGMVTVNSTSGIRALQLGCPVKTLGQAVYDIRGLAYQGELDRFWREAGRPDPGQVDAFVDVLAATIQIRGVFFSEPGLSAAVEAAAQRLFTGTVGERAI